MKINPVVLQFIRFCMVGVIGAIINFSLFFVLYRFFNIYYLISSGIGFIISVMAAFFLNRSFTFRVNKFYSSKTMLIKYYLVHLFSMGIGLSVLKILVDAIGLNVYLSNLFFIATTTSLNFIGSKLFAFRIKGLS